MNWTAVLTKSSYLLLRRSRRAGKSARHASRFSVASWRCCTMARTKSQSAAWSCGPARTPCSPARLPAAHISFSFETWSSLLWRTPTICGCCAARTMSCSSECCGRCGSAAAADSGRSCAVDATARLGGPVRPAATWSTGRSLGEASIGERSLRPPLAGGLCAARGTSEAAIGEQSPAETCMGGPALSASSIPASDDSGSLG
mmetsp:Transcript_21047/g.65824  ORF Transcript_21047/g.65824 Transcript_21047/m.65824 type:complete len:202 (-) Transcript_21047:953-1558(-)